LKRTTKKGGRPWKETRDVVNGVLWVLRTGAPWADLPRRYPPYQTCHRRFQTWVEEKTLERLLRRLAEDLRDRGKLDLTEAFIDGSHAGAKRGALMFGKTRRGKATKIMAVADRSGLPIAVGIESGQRNEQKLVVGTLKKSFLRKQLPKILIGDKAYDSDPLDAELAAMGIEMISPHHPRRRRKTQDGRKLRRYKRRWKVERLFAWIFRFRRLVTRYEEKAENYLGLLQLACAQILLRRL
ncbi:MAG TPA: IS5 family transposase, partial [Kofleriaceae bacterium]|nr:IS5 family transposase [Kofleriaceae bacterium]